jgi:hypothetical protein
MTSNIPPSNRKSLCKNSDGVKASNPATSTDESDTGDRDKTDAKRMVHDSDRGVPQAMSTQNSNVLSKCDSSSGANDQDSREPNAAVPAKPCKYNVDRSRLPNGQWPPGVSGNPKGRKPKKASNYLDQPSELEKALEKKVKLKHGDKERAVTKRSAIREQWINQAAKGDYRARRDLIAYAEKHGIDLFAGQHKAIQKGIAEAARSSSSFILTEEMLDRLSQGALEELTRVVEELEVEKKKKMH